MFAEISQRSIEEKMEALELCRVLRSLNPRWRCLVDESKEWAAYRLVNADFRDDDGNFASIRQVDQRACCLKKWSDSVEIFQDTVGVAGLSLFELRQLRSYIEREMSGRSVSYFGLRGCESLVMGTRRTPSSSRHFSNLIPPRVLVRISAGCRSVGISNTSISPS